MSILSSETEGFTPVNFVWLIFGLIAVVYVFEAPPQPAWGDGLSFLYTSEAGLDLDTNATSHFLYRNLGYVLASALAFWPNAGVLVGLSLVSALVVLGLTYKLARIAAGRAGSLFGVGVLALAFTFWRHAVTIEVYAFNLIFVALILLLAVHGIVQQDGRHAVALSILWGLTFLVHIQNILLAPLALYYLWSVRPTLRLLAVSTGLFAAVVAPLIIIPLLLENNTLDTVFVGNPTTGLTQISLASAARGVLPSLGYVAYNFHVWLIPIAIGAVRLWRNQPEIARPLILVAGPYWLFAMSFPVSDSYVFYLGAYVCAVPCAALGFDTLLSRVSAKARRYAIVISLIVGPAIYATAVEVGRTTTMGHRIEETKSYKGGLRFYLYPGMHGAPNPLDLARTLQTAPGEPPIEWDPQWAIRYLELEARSR